MKSITLLMITAVHELSKMVEGRIVIGGVTQLNETGQDLLSWAQGLGITAAAIAFVIGGFYLIFGGDRGRTKSIGWFVGGAAGLIVVMGANALAEGVDDQISF